MTQNFKYKTNVVIGTGAVGDALARGLGDDLAFRANSKLITNEEIYVPGDSYNLGYRTSAKLTDWLGRHFHNRIDNLFYAAIPGRKYIANSNPEQDEEEIRARLDTLLKFVSDDEYKVENLFFISTTDVQFNHAYGRNRLAAEQFVMEQIAPHVGSVHIVRLPMLIGEGVKKNLLFDLMNDRVLPDELTIRQIELLNEVIESAKYEIRQLVGEDISVVADRSKPTDRERSDLMPVQYLPDKETWRVVGAGTYLVDCVPSQTYKCLVISDLVRGINQMLECGFDHCTLVSRNWNGFGTSALTLDVESMSRFARYGTTIISKLRLDDYLYNNDTLEADTVPEDSISLAANQVSITLKKSLTKHVNDMITTQKENN